MPNVCDGNGFVPDDAEDEEVTRTAKWTTDVRFTPADSTDRRNTF
jgi:hypothetical protein